MDNQRIIVAVDGPAGSGKSSVSKTVAIELGLKYIDSGALYRSITWHALKKHGKLTETTEFTADLNEIGLKQEFQPDGTSKTFVNGEDISLAIRDEEISKNIGIISDNTVVRDYVNNLLRVWSQEISVIMDGRDIGSVVFPQAQYKIYLDASVEERTKRRVKEYSEMGKNVDEISIKNQIIQRDGEDKNRPFGKLVRLEDAVYIDTSKMEQREVVDRIENIIRGKFMEQAVQEFNDTIDMEHVLASSMDEIQPGRIVTGEVVTVDSDYAYINVGQKSDGRIPIEEFETAPEVGEKYAVVLHNKRLVDGLYQFSKREADMAKSWQDFLDWYSEEHTELTGRIKSSIKNGKIVEAEKITAFLPFSQAADLKGVDSTQELYTFKIKTVDKKKKSIVVSRKEYLDEQNKVKWENFKNKYNVGDMVTGEVIKFVEFGAFVRVDGVDTLLHRNDMTWRKVFKQRKILKQGEQREFLILDINKEEGKVSLGMKQLKGDPWLAVQDQYTVGSVVKGLVVTITAYGAFIEIEEGVEGFINNSELSWTKNNANVNDYLQRNEEYEFKILDINFEERKMSLGYKHLQPNPWDNITEKYPVGSIHKKTIKKIVKFGMFVEFEDNIDGLVHISDVSWDDVKNVEDLYKVGDTVEVKVLDIKKNERKISCGIKQLARSPWEVIREKYPPRKKINGVVSGITQFGIFVKLEDDVEGLVHVSEISKKRIEDLEEHFKVGDPVNVIVLGVDIDKKRLSLSIKQYDMIAEKEELDKIMKNASPSTATLGDFFDIKLENK